ncbi:MAG: DUF1804 family protein [Magnetococcus sp. YQC-5]
MPDGSDLQNTMREKSKKAPYGEHVRLAVKASYQENGGNLALAARTHGVSLTTARRWKQLDNTANHAWDLASTVTQESCGCKTLSRCGKGLAGNSRETLVESLLHDYLGLHKDAVDAVKNQVDDPLRRVDALSRLSQALDRTLRALGKASPELSRLAVASWVLERQAEFVKHHFPHHLPALLELLEPFGEELVREVEK